MTVTINHITIDCADPYSQSLFWSAATGFGERPNDRNQPDRPSAAIVSADGSVTMLFVAVPEGKTTKNRVHLDVVPADGTRDEEVERLIALGATLLEDDRLPDGRGSVVLQDPEGNEFCVQRGQAERDAAELSAHPS